MQFQRLLYQSVLWRGLFFISQLFLNILIARLYEPAGSGWLFYTLNNYAFILLVLSVSIDSGMGYYLASGKMTASKFGTLAFSWAAVAACVSFVGLQLFPQPSPGYGTTVFAVISTGFIVGNLLISFFSALFYAKKDFYTPSIILVSVNILLVLLLTIVSDEPGRLINSTQFLYIYIFSFFLQGLLFAFFFQFRYASSFAFPSLQEMKTLLRYSLLAFIGNLLTFFVFRIDYWFINYFGRSADELGNYIQVSKLTQLFFTVPSVLATAVFPLAAGGLIKLSDDLRILSRILVFFATGGCVIIGISGYWLFPMVFGEKFDKMYIPFLLLIPGIVAICLAYPLAGYFSGIKMVRVNVLASLFALVLIVIGNVIFIPLYGINGAATVSSIGYIMLCAYMVYMFQKKKPGRIRDFFMIKKSDLQWLMTIQKKASGENQE